MYMLPDVNHGMVQLKRFKWMHQLTTGVTTGGSLALVYRLLSWADSHPWYPPAAEVCEALSGGNWRLDYPSFAIGVTVGICIYILVEFAVTLRWAFVNWVASQSGCQQGGQLPPRPTFKFLA